MDEGEPDADRATQESGPSDQQAPLSDLRDRIEAVDREGGGEESAFSRLVRTLSDDADGDVGERWATLDREITRRANPVQRAAEYARSGDLGRHGRAISRHRSATSLRDNFQVHVLATHGFVTFGLIGLGIGVMATAVASVIPTPFWLFSLPLLLTGLVGVLPIAAWILGVWDPQRI